MKIYAGKDINSVISASQATSILNPNLCDFITQPKTINMQVSFLENAKNKNLGNHGMLSSSSCE